MNKSLDEIKKHIAEYVVENYVVDGMNLGLGTGSTCEYAIKKIASSIQDKKFKNINIFPTSTQTKYILDSYCIPYSSLNINKFEKLDLSIDGADEVDSQKHLIKGGGGALLNEKIVEYYSKKLVIFIDYTKEVKNLGTFFVGVEVIPFCYNLVLKELKKLGCKSDLRIALKKAGPVITDSGNFIIDCKFDIIKEPQKLEKTINEITGVVENGLFFHPNTEIVVGYENGEIKTIK